MARPTKYDPSFIEITREYIASCGREATELPTIEGLAGVLRVDADTIDNWAKENEEFFGTIKELKSKQKNQLMNDGLYGGKEVNTAMAIFLLKVNHGLVETTRQEVGGVLNSDGTRQPVQLLINSGQGFVPATVQSTASSTRSNTPVSPEVQSTGMAQESKKDDNSNMGSSQAGTS
jgi:hypothetical protein